MSQKTGCGTTRHAKPRTFRLFVWVMGLSAIGRAELKSSSTNGNASLKSAESARKMGAGPLVPQQKLRNEWVSRIKGVGSFPVERNGTGTFARRYSIRLRISRKVMSSR